LPATLIYNKTSRNFYEKEFDEGTLNNLIETTIKQSKL
jgi:hypothetical protein